jgi:hypothetical protein
MNQAVLRSLLRPIDDLFFLGLFFILLNKQEKRIGDLVAGTLVVQEEREGKADIHCSERAQQLALELPDQSQITYLTPDDFAVIRAYLRRRKAMTARSRTEISMKLAHQTRQLIQLDVIPSNVTSEDFLEALYLVYQERSPRFG